MAFSDWTLIAPNCLKLRLGPLDQVRDQINAFLLLPSLARENALAAALVDIRDCEPHPIERAPEVAVFHIAHELRDSSLHFLAIADEGYRKAWWRYMIPSLRALGMRAKLFGSVRRAERWVCHRGLIVREPVGHFVELPEAASDASS